MSIVLETLTFGAGAVSAISFRELIARRRKPAEVPVPEAMKWNREYCRHFDGSYWAFPCPKCNATGCNQKVPLYCECEEFHEPHYHFVCGRCKFASLMYPADRK
jgi:hypothetical protein